MTAAQRLELLKEVGGSTVYEERRNESQKLLEEAERKRTAVRHSWHTAGCQRLAMLLAWLRLLAALLYEAYRQGAGPLGSYDL